ncbi:MAG: hypothetical protein FJ134_12355 [Deltaproteobacteria bacterium]|nr:hypothetical protein [Deltaproteobacteria bacterium]
MKKGRTWSVMLALALFVSGSLAAFDILMAKEAVPTSSDSQTRKAQKAQVGKKKIYHELGRVMGGQRTDGKDLFNITFGKHDDFERLVLDIHEWVTDENLLSKGKAPPTDIPCSFEVYYEEYPFRLVFDLEGVREMSATFPNISASNYISNIYELFAHSWGNVRFAVTLKKPINYEVFELHNPAKIVADIKEGEKSSIQFPPIYSLRTQSYNIRSSNLRDIHEKITYLKEGEGNLRDDWGREEIIPKGKKVRMLQSKDNKLFIEEGYYKTKQEALKRQKIFAKKGITLFIEKRNVDEIPRGLDK